MLVNHLLLHTRNCVNAAACTKHLVDFLSYYKTTFCNRIAIYFSSTKMLYVIIKVTTWSAISNAHTWNKTLLFITEFQMKVAAYQFKITIDFSRVAQDLHLCNRVIQLHAYIS